jgi:hypothetical protein
VDGGPDAFIENAPQPVFDNAAVVMHGGLRRLVVEPG